MVITPSNSIIARLNTIRAMILDNKSYEPEVSCTMMQIYKHLAPDPLTRSARAIAQSQNGHFGNPGQTRCLAANFFISYFFGLNQLVNNFSDWHTKLMS